MLLRWAARGDRDLSRRRGFWRLTFVVWLLLSAGLVAATSWLASPSPLFPFQKVGPDGTFRPDMPSECSTALAAEGEMELSLDAAFDRLKRLRCDAQRSRLTEWETTAVWAFRTQEYWTGVRKAAFAVAYASALIWGLFYLAVWVAAGFRAES
jgi:hypothetical protein